MAADIAVADKALDPTHRIDLMTETGQPVATRKRHRLQVTWPRLWYSAALNSLPLWCGRHAGVSIPRGWKRCIFLVFIAHRPESYGQNALADRCAQRHNIRAQCPTAQHPEAACTEYSQASIGESGSRCHYPISQSHTSDECNDALNISSGSYLGLTHRSACMFESRSPLCFLHVSNVHMCVPNVNIYLQLFQLRPARAFCPCLMRRISKSRNPLEETMYTDQQLKAQLQQQAAYECTKNAEPMNAVCGQAVAGRPFTLSEEAQRSEQFHYDQAAKAGSAARFLSAHPEFDEFIRLVRAGALQF